MYKVARRIEGNVELALGHQVVTYYTKATKVLQHLHTSPQVKLLKKGKAKRRSSRFEHRDGVTLGVALHRCAKRHHVGTLLDALLFCIELNFDF